MRTGGCHCGAVRYEAEGEPVYSAICHCEDCRASAGAPMVAWMAFPEAQVTLASGELTTFEGSPGSFRQFCTTCGTGLFFRNVKNLPGLIDVQAATLDDAGEHAPQLHVQCAERLPWVKDLGSLPEFERYPGPVS